MATSPPNPETVRRFSSPQEEVLLSLMRTADCLHREFQQRLRPFGLTPAQYNVLRILRAARPAGLTCSAIGRSMIAPEPDITRLLARLKTQKLLSQQRDVRDRRILWTHISEAGLEVLSSLDETVERAPLEMFQELNCEEVRELARLLHKAQSCRAHQPQNNAGPRLAGRANSGISQDSAGHRDAAVHFEDEQLTARRPSPRPLRLPRRPE
jgi:DNA-binding MarR family transcriptional regulator